MQIVRESRKTCPMVKRSSSKVGQDSDVLLMEAGTGLVFVLYCSPGHLHLGSSWSRAPAHLKTLFLPVWLVLLNLCAVEGSGNDAGGHGGYQVQVLKHQEHRMPLYFIPVSVSLRLARTLLKRLLSKN